MTNNEEIVFDASSGISVEEQKEILSKINGIAEQNRSRLSRVSGEKQVIKAKKNSAIFPILFNIAAILILCGGGFFLISFNGKKDAQVREGTTVFNLTERALIEEIRRDTSEKIAAKEQEISLISSRLEDVDAQLLLLQSSNIELTAEQLTAQDRLLTSQNTYRADLIALREERSQILEDARSREARLRAQLEERTREFTAAQERTSSELDYAMGELERLANDQERIAAIDAQLAGGLVSISEFVHLGHYAQAALAVDNLRFLCNNNSVANVRSFQAKREFYNQAFDSMETIINEMRRFQEINSGGWELYEKNVQLEETVAEMQRTIDAFSVGSSGQARRLSELEESVSSLRAANVSLETTAAERENTISSLRTERASLSQTVEDLRTVNAEQEQEVLNLRSRLSLIQQAMQE